VAQIANAIARREMDGSDQLQVEIMASPASTADTGKLIVSPRVRG